MVYTASENAIMPKARAIFARRISPEEYIELCRKRSVPEVAQFLKGHLYFQKSLSQLSDTVPHRDQLEDLLTKDIYYKFSNLMRYSFDKTGFEKLFIMDCEIAELLKKLEIMANGIIGTYITRLPGFLIGKLNIDLMELAKAKTFDEVIKTCEGTPYSKILQQAKPAQNTKMDYLYIEHLLKNYYYKTAVEYCKNNFSSAELDNIESLFKMEAEIYNLDLITRVKTYFENSFTPERVKSLLIDVYYKIPKRKIYELCDAKTFATFLTSYQNTGAAKIYGRVSERNGILTSQSLLYKKARQVLRFTNKPQIAATAVLVLCRIERMNVISVIEGVRYKLPTEKIIKFIKY